MKLIFTIIFLIGLGRLQAQQSDFKHISFDKADRIALTHKDESLKNLPELTYKLTKGLTTDVEKFRAIYKWVCIAVSNDYDLWDLNESKRSTFKNKTEKLEQWNAKIKKKLYQNLLKRKQTICSGYAFLLKDLCELAGLRVEVIHGFGRTAYTNLNQNSKPNHSWNSVYLNEKWYLVDATWASGKQNPITFEFEFDYSDGYFLAHPQLFKTNHFPIDLKWQLIGNETFTFQSFLAAPLFYRDGFTFIEEPAQLHKFHTNINISETGKFSYKFKIPIDSKSLVFQLDDGVQVTKIYPEIDIKNETTVLSYRFEHTGFYDVHLLYNDTYLATYTYKVVP